MIIKPLKNKTKRKHKLINYFYQNLTSEMIYCRKILTIKTSVTKPSKDWYFIKERNFKPIETQLKFWISNFPPPKFGPAPAFDHCSYQLFILKVSLDPIDHCRLLKHVKITGYTKQQN